MVTFQTEGTRTTAQLPETQLEVYKRMLTGADPAKADVLGWLEPDEWAGAAQLTDLQSLTETMRSICDTFIVLGIGGSNNGARAVVQALQSQTSGPEIVWAATSLSPYELAQTVDLIEQGNCCIEVIAKNFETLEPGSWFRVLRQALERKYGREEAAGRIVCCGTRGASLHEIAQTEGYHFIPFPDNIGGRFSFLSPVGLLPVAVAGLDITQFAAGARAERQAMLSASSAEADVFEYAAWRNKLYTEGYKLEILASFEPRLAGFAKWWIQLFAESEGKDGKGLYPQAVNYSEDLHSVGQYIQDGAPILLETFLQIAGVDRDVIVQADRLDDGFGYLDGQSFAAVNQAAEKATMAAHTEKGVPVCRLQLPALDELSLGALMYFFEAACYISSEMLGVNGFDQPGVEAYKQKMFALLGKE